MKHIFLETHRSLTDDPLINLHVYNYAEQIYQVVTKMTNCQQIDGYVWSLWDDLVPVQFIGWCSDSPAPEASS